MRTSPSLNGVDRHTGADTNPHVTLISEIGQVRRE